MRSDGFVQVSEHLNVAVGWAMSDRMGTELALSALRMAAATRELERNWIHHTRPRLSVRQ
jgi:hypothetical protein